MNHVLLIDDVELVGMFSEYLEQEAFRTTCLHNGLDGAREALRGDYAIAILDVMMPGAMGADDYVAKPCTPRELTARVRAILRRTQAAAGAGPAPVLTVGKLSMVPEQRRAS